MSSDSHITQLINGSFNSPSYTRMGPRHRKRSSSLFALDDLRIPSPPPSPTVSINFSKDSNSTGEIPIVLDFLTTGSMSSEERISKMASLKPALPALVKFSPMSAFFPMSDSTGTLNTISTEAFGTKRPGYDYCETSQERCFSLSDYSAIYSPLSLDFNIPSPTEAVNYEAHDNAQDPMIPSTSTPALCVQNYDVGQKELDDISSFTISAYMTSPSVYGSASASLASDNIGGDGYNNIPRPTLSEEESRVSPTVSVSGLLSTPSAPDPDDKTPTQSTFFKRRAQDHNSAVISTEVRETDVMPCMTRGEGTPSCCGEPLAIPSFPDFDDKTPTQATFLKRAMEGLSSPSNTDGRAEACSTDCLVSGNTSTMGPELASLNRSSLLTPRSLYFDDKTPTQSMFVTRQDYLSPLTLIESPECIAQADTTTLSQTSKACPDPTARNSLRPSSRNKDLPAKPVEESSESEISVPEPDTSVSIASPVSIPETVLSPPVPCLRHAQWLRDTVVELWIDQEGFRAIRPKFFLASVSNGLPYSQQDYYSSPPTPPHTYSSSDQLIEEHDPLYTTVAEFLPVSRAAHYFHHAAFDRGPTLHRVTTGDETKDCITRAATISLRDNGVFFVQGTEDHRIGLGGAEDSPLAGAGGAAGGGAGAGAGGGGGGRVVRLNWRFEYFVSNRRPDGLSLHKGEKTITPLSFSCTPALLDRSRAHKVTVLHIMKKTLLPNLVAQKLEPPDLGPVPPGILRTQASASSLALSFMTPQSRSLATSEPLESRTGPAPLSPKSTRSSNGKVRIPSGSASDSQHATTTNDNSASKLSSFIPPRLQPPPPRPPLPYIKHRRGSHSDTTPEDYMRQQHRASQHDGSDLDRDRDSHTSQTHGRSRSASILQRSRGARGGHGSSSGSGEYTLTYATSPAQIISGPIIPQRELMKLLDAPSSFTSTRMTGPVTAAGSGGVDRRPHSIRVEILNNVQITTLPAAPRHRHNP